MAADALRQTLAELLGDSQAHIGLEAALAGLLPEWRTHRPPGLHSIWQLAEHIRLTQQDIIHYTLDATWRSPPWPEGYWPENYGDLTEATWQATLAGYREDLQDLIALVQNPQCDLSAELPHGEGRSYVRQILLVADHTAYHTGQIISLRRALGDWPPQQM